MKDKLPKGLDARRNDVKNKKLLVQEAKRELINGAGYSEVITKIEKNELAVKNYVVRSRKTARGIVRQAFDELAQLEDIDRDRARKKVFAIYTKIIEDNIDCKNKTQTDTLLRTLKSVRELLGLDLEAKGGLSVVTGNDKVTISFGFNQNGSAMIEDSDVVHDADFEEVSDGAEV